MCTCIVCLCVSVLGGRDSLAILLPLRWKQEKDILCRTIITSLPRETDLLRFTHVQYSIGVGADWIGRGESPMRCAAAFEGMAGFWSGGNWAAWEPVSLRVCVG